MGHEITHDKRDYRLHYIKGVEMSWSKFFESKSHGLELDILHREICRQTWNHQQSKIDLLQKKVDILTRSNDKLTDFVGCEMQTYGNSDDLVNMMNILRQCKKEIEELG